MRINIPTKLEKYKDHIKKSSYKIVYNKNFSFLKIGSTFKDNSYKELYLCYNPYNTNIVFDINSFKNDDKIYKLYPQIVNVPNQEIFAFMIFSTAHSELEFNLQSLIYNKKKKIETMLSDINKRNKLIDTNMIVEEYNDDINATMMFDDEELVQNINQIDKYNVDKTQYLGEYLNIDKLQEETIGYKQYSKNNKNIQVKLKNITFNKKKYVFIITFINNSIAENYFISKVIVNLFDKDNKEVVEINREIKIKKYSQKDMEFTVDEKILKDFNLNDVKVDIFLE